jgi:hypothetical protein
LTKSRRELVKGWNIFLLLERLARSGGMYGRMTALLEQLVRSGGLMKFKIALLERLA